MTKATFGAGCFWGVERAFRKIAGVSSTRVGYAGGKTHEPTYSMVCEGNTGHAEVVQIEFDPNKISYEALLEIFWKIHDPTNKNRQGVDIGSQYRSMIFYHDDEQKKSAEESKKQQQKNYSKEIITQIVPVSTFWEAEEYHQQYLDKLEGKTKP